MSTQTLTDRIIGEYTVVITRVNRAVQGSFANSWTVTVALAGGAARTAEFKTNKYGEGLWRDGRQILGTCQWAYSAARKRTESLEWAEQAASSLSHDVWLDEQNR